MAIKFQNDQIVESDSHSHPVTLNGLTIDYDVDRVERMKMMPTFMARSAFERILSGDDFVDKAALLVNILDGKRFVIYDDDLDNPTPDWMYPIVKGNEVELEYFPTWDKLDSWKQHHEYNFPRAY